MSKPFSIATLASRAEEKFFAEVDDYTDWESDEVILNADRIARSLVPATNVLIHQLIVDSGPNFLSYTLHDEVRSLAQAVQMATHQFLYDHLYKIIVRNQA